MMMTLMKDFHKRGVWPWVLMFILAIFFLMYSVDKEARYGVISLPVGEACLRAYLKGKIIKCQLAQGGLDTGYDQLCQSLQTDNSSLREEDQKQDPPVSDHNLQNPSPKQPKKQQFDYDIAPRDCDFSKGEWVYDSRGPVYTNDTCPMIRGHENCLQNGRRNKEYLYYRWKPEQCHIPRFDGKVFLELMRNKAVALIGDSITQDQFYSLICSLTQASKARQVYRDPTERTTQWHFPAYSFTLAVYWAPFLVFDTDQEFKGVEEGPYKLQVDVVSNEWYQNMSRYDALVVSGGQWFLRTNLHYYSQGKLAACYYCPNVTTGLPVNTPSYGYRLALIKVLETLMSEYKGLLVMRTFSADNYEGGFYGVGNCNRTSPLKPHEVKKNERDDEIHDIQVDVLTQLNQTVGSKFGSRVRLLDVTSLTYLRADGHPDGILPKDNLVKDCLHWCIPGPPDTWNELLLQVLLQEFYQKS